MFEAVRVAAAPTKAVSQEDLLPRLPPPADLIEPDRRDRPEQAESPATSGQQQRQQVAAREGARRHQADDRVEHAEEHQLGRDGEEIVPAPVASACRRSAVPMRRMVTAWSPVVRRSSVQARAMRKPSLPRTRRGRDPRGPEGSRRPWKGGSRHSSLSPPDMAPPCREAWVTRRERGFRLTRVSIQIDSVN